MSRPTATLADIGVDLSTVAEPPTLSRVVSQRQLDEATQSLGAKAPGVDFSPRAVKARASLLARVGAQIERAEASIARWKRQRADAQALQPFDCIIIRLLAEEEANDALTRTGVLGDLPPVKKRRRQLEDVGEVADSSSVHSLSRRLEELA